MKGPPSTPWRKADDVAELYEGIFSVKTTSHGGIMIHSSFFPQLSEHARSGQACIFFLRASRIRRRSQLGCRRI